MITGLETKKPDPIPNKKCSLKVIQAIAARHTTNNNGKHAHELGSLKHGMVNIAQKSKL